MEKNKKGNISAFLSGAIVATALAGYTFFLSKNSKKNRDVTEKWVDDAKEEALSKVKTIKKLSKDKYYEIVDQISDKYSKIKEVGSEKADQFREELKAKWQEVEEEAKKEVEEEEA